MENYTKGETHELGEELLPFPLDGSAVEMKVSNGSKIRNLMGFAMKKIKEAETQQVVWKGSGNAITKTVSCAEIMKRKIKGLHQYNIIGQKRTEEYWEPKLEGLERLKVNKDVPVMTIVLSKLPIDDGSDTGYQAPGATETFWKESARPSKQQSSYQRQENTPRREAPSGGRSRKHKSLKHAEKRKESKGDHLPAGKHRKPSSGGNN